ncbi:MAG: endonuclease/exonuclease/phosphatase family protein [Prevotella sp.]|jgi:endonuclease/exonuclease/phosphatase family metal-dependent hydrolase|nr:endonuclease/exonuclease/phosphatase family protein [Prevotella sp.]
MKKYFILLALAAVLTWENSHAQDKHLVMFYNVENLFDTIPSPGVYDREFTPGGAKKWNSFKYWKKIANIEDVLYKIASQERTFPAVIGLSEVENRNVLEDIVATPKLAKVNYRIVHYDSPESRGVDVALLYRPDIFKYEGSYPIKTVVPGLPDFKTRDILSVWGTIGNERFFFFVCHLPSRLGGQAASEFKRIAGAQIIKNAVDSICLEKPETRFIIMGDMNDEPTDKSLAQALGAKADPKRLDPGDLFNPFTVMFKDGIGSLAYQDAWSLFDNIIVSENLINAPQDGFSLLKKKKYYAYIFNKPFLTGQRGQYKGYPLRTFSGDNFVNGYSDHFPVYILLSK